MNWAHGHRGMPRRTVRLRLTLLYGTVFLAGGAGLLFITYLLVAHRLPAYIGRQEVSGHSQPGSSVVAYQASSGGTACKLNTGGGQGPVGPSSSAGSRARPALARRPLRRCKRRSPSAWRPSRTAS
jgi:hypothetical protein